MAPLPRSRRPSTPPRSRAPSTPPRFRTQSPSTPSRTPPGTPPTTTALPPEGLTGTDDDTIETIPRRRHPYIEATLEVEDDEGLLTTYTPSGTGDLWSIYVHCKDGLPDQEYVLFKLERPDIRVHTLSTIKDQLGYTIQDFLYYKKRCGRDVATLQPIQKIKHTETMIHDNEMEKEIRLVLSKQPETTQQVSITPLKRQRQQPVEEFNPFEDDAFDDYKLWLAELPKERSKDLPDDFRKHTVRTYTEFLRRRGDIEQIMIMVELRDVINPEDESIGSNASNRPSHARKARKQEDGDGSHERKKSGRGVLKGFAVTNKRIKERTPNLTIQFSEGRGGPTGPNTRAFIDEIVLTTKNYAPLIGVTSWKGIKDNVKELIAEEILLSWNFTNIASKEKKKEKIWDIARERYKGWRSALSATYKAYNTYAERIQNKPEDVDLFEWHNLILYFGSEKFMNISTQNSSNRKKQKTKHLMGSKSFSQRAFELRDEETGEEPSDLSLWIATHRKPSGQWSNSISAEVYENATRKIGDNGLEPDGQPLSAAKENMIFQSCYKETTQAKSSRLHGHGYLAKYQTRRELMKESLEAHARAEAVARERNIAFEAEVEKLKEQIAQQAVEREREQEELRRKMQEDMEIAKTKLREEMKQDFLQMLAKHKEATMDTSMLQNNESTPVAPTIQEEDETTEHEDESLLQQTQPGSVITVQKDATTRCSKNSASLSKNLFNEDAGNVATQKTFISQQQLLRTRSSRRKK